MVQSLILRDWLAVTPDHIAILPDFVWIEMYKQQSLTSVSAAFSVIGTFPAQIRLIKPGGDVASLDPRCVEMATQMIEPDVDVRQMLAAIALAERDDPVVMAEFARQWSKAAADMDGMLEGAFDIVESLPEIADIFSVAELRLCRTNARYTGEMFGKIFGGADQIYESLVEARGSEVPLSDVARIDAYLYRYALAIMIYALWWIKNGSQVPKRLEKVRNDVIDLSFAVYGTYFDGLFTDDVKANWMYENLKRALRLIRTMSR